MKQVAVGMYKSIRRLNWQKKWVFRLTLKVGTEGEALRSAGSEFQTQKENENEYDDDEYYDDMGLMRQCR